MKPRFVVGKVARGVSYALGRAGSRWRTTWLRLKYPEITVAPGSFIAGGCDIRCGRGAAVSIGPSHLSRGVVIDASAGATLVVRAEYLASGATVVARRSVVIGARTLVGEGVSIRDQHHARDDQGSLTGFVARPVTVAEDVWLGAGARVLAGVSVGRGATVGAGAVVTKDVAAGATVVGVPARPI